MYPEILSITSNPLAPNIQIFVSTSCLRFMMGLLKGVNRFFVLVIHPAAEDLSAPRKPCNFI